MRGLLKQIINSVNFNESTTILSFRDDGMYDLISKLFTDESVKSRFQKETEGDVQIRKFSARLMEKVISDSKEKVLLEYLGINVHDKDEFITLVQNGSEILFVIEEIDRLNEPERIIDILDQLIKQYQNLTCIYLLEDVQVFLKLQLKLEPNSSFFQNTIIMALEESKEAEYLQNICEKKYGKIDTTKKLKGIYKHSSGHFEIYKRLYKAEITGNYDSFENYARRLTRSFGNETLKIFRKVVNKVELTTQEEELIRIYRDLGFIKRSKITIPILEKYILDITPKENILLNEDGQIIFSNIQEFSKTEIKVLKTFLENQREIVTKEELGFVVWGNKVSSKYSPWALDQIIFRVRLKLDKLNLNGEIKTIHGKGYVFQA